MTLSDLFAYLDKQDPNLVMQAVQSMYEEGDRGIFCDKFISFVDLFPLGYAGLKQFLTSMYEVDEHFILANKGELENLKSKIQRLKGEFPDGH